MTGSMHLATTDSGNELLARDPFALLLGMLLDQQVTMEKAFTSPSVLAERLGVDRLDPAAIAALDPGDLEAVFRQPPALHRYPGSMAGRAHQLARVIAEEYGDDAAALWRDAPTGAELLGRLEKLPGFGAQKAKIFLALLGKQRGVTPKGWREAAGDYGLKGFRSVADVVDEPSLVKVREFKQAQKQAAKQAAAPSAT